MAAVFTGTGLGLFNSSFTQLGGASGGSGLFGQRRTGQYVNVATGNLVLQDLDESLLVRGMNAGFLRTYNSRGTVTGAGQDGWVTGFERNIALGTGTFNQSGSTMLRNAGDGTLQTFRWVSNNTYRSTDGDGADDTLTWDADARQWTYLEGSSRREELYADHAHATLQGRLVRIRDLKSDGSTPAQFDVVYNADNRVSEVCSTDGAAVGSNDAILFAYSETTGRLISVSTRENGVLKSQVRYGYDDVGRLSWVETDLTPDISTDNVWDGATAANNDGKRFRTNYAYVSGDANDLRIASVVTSDGQKVSFTYDLGGAGERVQTVTRGDASDGSAQTITFVYGADSTDVIEGAVGGGGRIWTYQYDANGQLTAVLEPQVNGLRQRTGYTYDTSGNVTRITVSGDAANAVTTTQLDTVFAYDTRGNRTLQRDRLGNTVVWTYTANDQVETETRYTSADVDGLDPAHIGTTNLPSGALTTTYVYDGQNRLRFVVNAAGEVRELAYATSGNGIGQVATERSYLGAVYTGTIDESSLNAWATNATAMRRASSELTAYSYDAKGRLSQTVKYATVSNDVNGNGVFDASSSLLNFSYDAQGLLRQQITLHGASRTTGGGAPADSEVIDYLYDGMGRLLSVLKRNVSTAPMPDFSNPDNATAFTNWLAANDPSTVLTHYAYVDSSNQVRVTFDAGMVRTEARNKAGLILSISEANAASGATVTRVSRNYYDGNGRLRASEDAAGGRSYVFYDDAGRISATVDATGAVTQLIYDNVGRLVQTVVHATRVDTSSWLSGSVVTKSALVFASTSPALTAAQAWVPTDATRDMVTQKAYDVAGRVSTETVVGADASQTRRTTYTYDAADRLLQVSVTDGAGTTATARTTRHLYDKADRKIAQVDVQANGQAYVTEFVYDLAGRVVKTIRYADATTNPAATTLADLKQSIDADANDQITRMFYDGRGNLVGSLDAEGYLTEFVYDEALNQRAVKAYERKLTGLTGNESLSTLRASATVGYAPETGFRKTQRQFNALGQLETELNHEGTVTRYTYDEAGRLVRTESAFGATEVRTNNLRYDVFGNVIGEIDGQGVKQAMDLLTGGKTLDDTTLSQATLDAVYAQYGVRHSYDLLGRRIESTDAQGNKIWTFHDGEGRVTFVVRGQRDEANVLNARAEVTETRYDALGRVIDTIAYGGTLTVPVPGSRASVQSVLTTLVAVGATDSRIELSYDRRGLLIERKVWGDGNARDVTRYGYNAFGELVTQQDMEADGTTARRTTAWTYDARGQATAMTQSGGGLSRTTLTTYDAFGRAITRTDARGTTTSIGYDRVGRVITQSTTISGRAEASSLSYDAYGRIVTQTDALGNVTTYAYNDANRSMTMTSPEGVSVTTTRNRHGEAVTVSQTLPGGGTSTTTTAYDKDGNVTSVTDALGKVTSNEYDTRGLLAATVDASGRRVEYRYDAAGRVLQRIEDPGAGKLNLTTTTTYDAQGRQVRVTDASGRVTTFVYDRKGNLTETVRDPGGLNLRTSYTWDRDGRQLTVTEGQGGAGATTTAYVYDALGRRTQEIRGSGSLNLTTTYAYDSNDNVISRTDGSGRTTRYAYDAANRLRFTVDGLNGITEVAYDAAGRATMTRRYAKVGVSGLPTTPSEADFATHVQTQGYRNDALDEVTYRVYDRDGRVRLSIDGVGGVRETVYDSAGRVQREVAYVKTLSMLAAQHDGLKAGTTTIASLGLNTLVSANDMVVRHVYDAAGQRRYSVDATGAVSGVWYDAAGRVVATRGFAQRISLALVTDGVTQGQIEGAVGAGAASDAVMLYVYDGAGRQRYALRANGNAGAYPASQSVTETRYDAAGRMLLTQTYVASLMLDLTTAGKIAGGNGVESDLSAFVAANPATARVTRTVYDTAGRATYTIDGTGAYTRVWRDAADRVVASRTFATRLSAAALAALSDATTTASLDGQLTWLEADQAQYRIHDAAGRLRFSYSSMGQLQETRYDGADRVLSSIAYVPPFWGDGSFTNKLLSGTATEADFASFTAANTATAQTQRMVYDAAGNATFGIDGTGAYVRRWYDGIGREIARVRFAARMDLTGVNDASTVAQLDLRLTWPSENETSYRVYDAAGRVRHAVQLTSPSTASITEVLYDGAGRRLRERAYTALMTFDQTLASKLVSGTAVDADFSVFTAANAATAQTTRMVYDAAGQVRYTVDALGYAIQSAYDGTGRLSSRHTYRNAIALSPALVAKFDAGTVIDADISNAAGAPSTVAPWSTGFDSGTIAGLNLSGLDPQATGAAKVENGRLVFARKPSTGSLAWTMAWGQGVYSLSDRMIFRSEVSTDASQNNNYLLMSLRQVGGAENEGIHINNGQLYSYRGPNGSEQMQSLGVLSASTTYVVEMETSSTGIVTYVYVKGQGRESGFSFSRTIDATSFGNFQLLLHGRSDAGVTGENLYVDNLAILNGNAAASESYRYNAAGQLIARVDGVGNTETYGYDAAGRRVSVTDANGNTSRTVYDSAGNVAYSIDATGAFTRTWYNAAGQAVSIRRFNARFDMATLSDATSMVQLDNQLGPIGAWSAGYQQEYRVYDAAGQLQLVYDGAGYLTRYEYDGAGRLVTTRRFASQFFSGDTTLTDRLFTGRAGYSDFAAFMTANESTARIEARIHDAAGQLTYVLQRSAGQWTVVERAYDGVGRTLAETRYGVTIAYTPGQGAGAVIAALQAQFSADPAIAATQSRTTRYLYDSAGQTRFVLDPTFAVSEQRYDGAGRVIETRTYSVRPNNISIDTGSLANWANTQAAADVRKVTNIYDVAGRLTARTDALNNSETFTYDAADRMLTRTDRMGAVWTYQYDAAGRKTAEISPQAEVYGITAQGALSVALRSVVTRYAYNGLGQLVSQSEDADNASGKRTTRYDYDKVGRLVKTTLPHPGSLDYYSGEIVYSGPAPTVEITYDALGNAVVQKDANNHYSYKIYDGFGRVQAEVDQEHNVSTYLYNAYGEQIRLLRYAARLVTTGSAFTSANWQAGKEITWSQIAAGVDNANGLNRFIYTDYNQRGEKTEVRLSAVEYRNLDNTSIINSGTPTTRYEYNAYGEVVREKVLQAGTDFWAETYRYYDRAGRMTHVVDAEGYMTEMQYNATGEVVKTIEYARTVATRNAPLSTVANPSYAGFTGSLGLSLTQPPAVPAAGDAATGFNRETQWTYDLLGRKSSETLIRNVRGTNGVVQQQSLTSSYGYDAEDRVTTLTNATGTTSTTYNALGQVTSLREPARLVLVGSADTVLQNSSATSLASSGLYESRSPYTTMAYDGLGRLIAARRHANGHDGVNPPAIDNARDQVTLNVYDALGRVVMTQNGLGDRTWSHYDNTDKLTHSWTRHRRSDGNNDTVVHRDYTYDKTGRQISAKQRRMTLDGVTLLGTDQFEVATYNAFGEIVSKAYEGIQGTLQYTYDNAGRLVTDNSTGAVRKYAYNLAGQQTRESHWVKLDAASAAVEVATTMTVDGLGRTLSVLLPTHTTDPGTTSTVQQGYDRWGNVVRVIDARGYQTDYEFNDQNQMVKETRPLVWVVGENGAGSWQRPVLYRYHDVQGRLIGTRDANGNLRQYSYDAVGQQVSVTDALNNVTRYAYDVFGHQRMTQDALGYVTWQEFDRADRVTAIGDFLLNGAARTRHVRQSYLLNQNGDRLTVTNALSHTTKYDYDSQSRLIRSETAMGVVQGYAYDVMGRKVLETNALTEAVSNFTDRDGDQVRLGSLTWKHDAFGRVVDHNNLSGRDYDYAYDALSGKMLSESAMGGAWDEDSSSGYRDYAYYRNGLIRHVREYSQTVAPQSFNTPFAEYSYEYDAAGNRTVEKTWFKDAYNNQLHSIVRSEYDSNNRVSKITQDDLDNLGNIIKRNFELRYDYDLNGNRRRVLARSGYGENLLGVPLENGAPTGPVSSNLLPSQVHDKWFAYDAENRVRVVNGVLSGAAGAAGTMIQSEANSMESFEHTYDQAGRIAWKVKRGISPFNGQEVITFERTIYNERGLLQHTYIADSTSASDNPYSSRYIYDAADQLIEMRRYAPDLFGNLAGAYGDKWINYLEARTYDADGRLVLQTTKVRNLAPLSVLPNGPDDLSILIDDSRTEFIKQDGTSGYDAAGRVVAYRYAKKGGSLWRTDYFTSTYEGWETWQEKSVRGRSSDINYRSSTNTLLYDPFGRLSTQVESTPVPSNYLTIYDRARAYSYNGDGSIVMRRGGAVIDGSFTQSSDDATGIRGNTLFIHAARQQQAELAEGGNVRTINGDSLVSQLTTLNGGSLYKAGGGLLVAVEGETLASMSLRAYGVDSYWYLIGDANGLSDRDGKLVTGMQYKIPEVAVNKNDAKTFKPYNVNEAIGGTQPDLPYPEPAPPKGKCDWLQVAVLIIMVVAVSYVTLGVMTQPAVTAALGAAAPVVTGAAVGAAASATASIVTTGELNWRSIAAGAITGALTAGLSTWAQGVGSIAAQAVRAVGTAAASYVGNKLAGVKNTHFSWKSVVANMVAADLSAAAGMGIDAVVANPQIADALKQASSSVISARVRKDMGVDKKFDWAGVAQGVFQAGITALSSIQRQPLTPDQKKEYARLVENGIPEKDALKYSQQTPAPIPTYLLRDQPSANPAFGVRADDPFAFFRASANTAFSADAAISSDVLSSLDGGWPWDVASTNSVWGGGFNAGGGNVNSGGNSIRLRESLLAQARAIEPYAGVLMDKQDLGSVAGIRDYISTYGDLAVRNRTAVSTSRSIFAYESAARSDYRASVLMYARYKGYEMPNDWSSAGIADYVNRGYRNQSDMDVIRVVGEASPTERAYRNSLAMLDRGQGVGVIKPEFRARWQQSGGRVDTNRYYATEAEYRQFMKEESWRFIGVLSAGPAAGVSMGLAAVSPLFAAGMTAYSFYSGGKQIQNGNLAAGVTEIALSMMGMRGLASQWSGVTGVRSALVNTRLLFGAAGRAGSSGVSVDAWGGLALPGGQTRRGLLAAEKWYGVGRAHKFEVVASGGAADIAPSGWSVAANTQYMRSGGFVGTVDAQFVALTQSERVGAAFGRIEAAFGKAYADRTAELFYSVRQGTFKSADDLGSFDATGKRPIIKLNENLGNADVMALTILHEVRHLRQFNKLAGPVSGDSLAQLRAYNQAKVKWRYMPQVDQEVFATSTNIWQGRRLGLSSDDFGIFTSYYHLYRTGR